MTTSFIKKSATVVAAGLFVAIAAVLSLAGSASAIQIPYVEGQPLPSIEKPVFNTFTNLPNGVGNEADFVRIRPSTGDVADNGEGGVRNALYVNGHRSDCEIGNKFDVRTYIHNGASEEFNDNGNGSAIAHETVARMNAPLNSRNTTFTFSSSISAKDVSPVTDTARLYCNGGEVMLKLVPKSVKVYSKHYSWQQAPDSSVNGNLPIGSRTFGNGDVWGCWNERVVVAYIVEVVKAPKPPKHKKPVYSCDLLSMTFISDRKYRFSVDTTAQNGATVKEYRFNFGDGSDVLVTTDNPVEHTFAKPGTYKPNVEVTFVVNGKEKTVSGDKCNTELTIEEEVEPCPVEGKGHLPKGHPDCKKDEVKSVVKEIPNTGAGGLFGLLTVIAVAGAALHRKLTLSR